MKGRKVWRATLVNNSGSARKVIDLPGGLSEAEARRWAHLKAGRGWSLRRIDFIHD